MIALHTLIHRPYPLNIFLLTAEGQHINSIRMSENDSNAASWPQVVRRVLANLLLRLIYAQAWY